MEVPYLIRNLAGNLIGADWVLIRLFAESKVISNEHKRDRYTEPHTH